MQAKPPAEFTLHATPGPDGLHVAVCGELDSTANARLIESIGRELPEPTPVILDFADLTFCDSMGLQALVGLQRRQTDAGYPIRILNSSDHVRRLLEMTGLLEYLNVEQPTPIGHVDGDLRPG